MQSVRCRLSAGQAVQPPAHGRAKWRRGIIIRDSGSGVRTRLTTDNAASASLEEKPTTAQEHRRSNPRLKKGRSGGAAGRPRSKSGPHARGEGMNRDKRRQHHLPRMTGMPRRRPRVALRGAPRTRRGSAPTVAEKRGERRARTAPHGSEKGKTSDSMFFGSRGSLLMCESSPLCGVWISLFCSPSHASRVSSEVVLRPGTLSSGSYRMVFGALGCPTSQ